MSAESQSTAFVVPAWVFTRYSGVGSAMSVSRVHGMGECWCLNVEGHVGCYIEGIIEMTSIPAIYPRRSHSYLQVSPSQLQGVPTSRFWLINGHHKPTWSVLVDRDEVFAVCQTSGNPSV